VEITVRPAVIHNQWCCCSFE